MKLHINGKEYTDALSGDAIIVDRIDFFPNEISGYTGNVNVFNICSPNTYSHFEAIADDGSVVGEWPLSREEQSLFIDRNTGESISSAIHKTAGIEEQISLLRAAVVNFSNSSGIDLSEGFKEWNAMAINEIEKAQIEKESL